MTADWTEVAAPQGVDLDQPGIFAWIVEGRVLYVGRATPLRNRWAVYERNVRDRRAGRPWHGDPSRNFRRIHEALDAAFGRVPAVFAVLEVCPPGTVDLKERKRHWVTQLNPTLDEGAAE